MTQETTSLNDLRREIDRIDDAMHDLLMERAALSGAIRLAKTSGGGPIIQPRREAGILRRLSERHRGPLPFGVVARIWREIISTMAALQRNMSLAVYAPDDDPGPWDLARDHFGSQIPMTPLRSASQVIRMVAERDTMLGILPMPSEDDRDPWWPQLVSSDLHAPRILQRLPAMRLASGTPGGQGNARGLKRDVLVIARQPADPAGMERVYLALEIPGAISRTRLLAAIASVGLDCGWLTIWEGGGTPLAFIELAGPLPLEDPRLRSLTQQLGEAFGRVYHLGGHPAPLVLA